MGRKSCLLWSLGSVYAGTHKATYPTCVFQGTIHRVCQNAPKRPKCASVPPKKMILEAKSLEISQNNVASLLLLMCHQCRTGSLVQAGRNYCSSLLCACWWLCFFIVFLKKKKLKKSPRYCKLYEVCKQIKNALNFWKRRLLKSVSVINLFYSGGCECPKPDLG